MWMRCSVLLMACLVIAGCGEKKDLSQQEIYQSIKEADGNVGVYENTGYSFSFVENGVTYTCTTDPVFGKDEFALQDSWSSHCVSEDGTKTGKVVSLKTSVLFDFASSKLRFDKASEKALDGLINAINMYKTIETLRIEGHADQIGDRSFNHNLSVARANSLKDYLSNARIGFDPAIIKVVGRGETMPVAECWEEDGAPTADLIECLQPNRRVDVVITGR